MKNNRNIWSETWKHHKEIFLIYLLQLISGACMAMIAYQGLSSEIGNSAELESISAAFDRTVFMDMIYTNRQLFVDVIGSIKWLLPIYLIASIILHAGLLGNIRNGETSFADFGKNAKKYAFKFSVVGIIAILSVFLWVGGIYFVASTSFGNPIETFYSEKPFVYVVMALLFLTMIGLIMIWGWSVRCRYAIIDGLPLFTAMKARASSDRRSLLYIVGVGLFLVLAHIGLFGLFSCINQRWVASSWISILLFILIQQGFTFSRIFLRVIGFSWLNWK